LDVHGWKKSQNGFDNSGRAQKVIWTEDGGNFTHWPNKEADWMSKWNNDTQSYEHVDFANMGRSLIVVRNLLKRWGAHSAFAAFEPVNEPLPNESADILKDFYRLTRKLVQWYAPQAHFVFHDQFINDHNYWADLFADNDIHKVAMDVHYYQSFTNTPMNSVEEACGSYEAEAMKAED